jgi:hypothetical protein
MGDRGGGRLEVLEVREGCDFGEVMNEAAFEEGGRESGRESGRE